MSNPPPPIDYATPGLQQPKASKRWIGWLVFGFLAITFFMLMRQGRTTAAATANMPAASLSQFHKDVMSGSVDNVSLTADQLVYVKMNYTVAGSTLTNTYGGTFRVALPPGMRDNWDFLHWVMEPHEGRVADVSYESQSGGQDNLVMNLLLPLIPWLLIFGFIYFFFVRGLWRQQAAVLANPRPTHVVIDNPEALRS